MENIENYLNTMIFIVIAKGITIALLLLLLFKLGQQMSYIIVSFQIGLLAIAIYAIVVIVKYNKRMNELKIEMGKEEAKLDTCPIYFKRHIVNDEVSCENESTLGDNYTKISFPANVTLTNITSELKRAKTMDGLCANTTFPSYPWAEFKGKCNK
jgi:ABC-type multidrug transport system fused ATPase/permease subunit